jgi:hypothetical protein
MISGFRVQGFIPAASMYIRCRACTPSPTCGVFACVCVCVCVFVCVIPNKRALTFKIKLKKPYGVAPALGSGV